MRRGKAIPEDYPRNEAALGAIAVLDGNVAPVDERLPFGISRRVDARPASKERDQCLAIVNVNTSPTVCSLWKHTYPDVQSAVEPLAELSAALELVSREELVRRESDARVRRLGRVERRQDKLPKSVRLYKR